MDIFEALEKLEAELGIVPPMGAGKIPPRARYHRVLARIRDVICPKLKQAETHIKAEKGSFVAIISDAILVGLANLELPATTIARSIVIIGIDNFCLDPALILNVK